MSNDALYLLIQSLGAQVLEHQRNPSGSLAILMSETLKFRDKLKEETGQILTVEDTRRALDGLEQCLDGRPMPSGLTPEQQLLAQIWLDRLTLFKGK
ncbi:MAG TPA: hypothetical protein VMS71_03355 [Candidatus Acidoferrum sp.]|nr:hypothetical protein [Candidatus Acidoferrum sp.]